MSGTKSMTALFVPIDAVGHVFTSVGIAQQLISAGHRAVFAISQQWKGKLSEYGIEEVLLPDINHSDQWEPSGGDPATYWAKRFKDMGLLSPMSTVDKMKIVYKNMEPVINHNMQLDLVLDQWLLDIRPDVVFVDQIVGITAVERSGIPWVLVSSLNPLFLMNNDNYPPSCSGR